MKNTYTIFTRTNEHPRTINTPAMGRINYTMHTAEGKDNAIAKIQELTAKGEKVTEVRYHFGCCAFNFWEYL